MSDSANDSAAPEVFRAAIESIHRSSPRAELELSEIRAPGGLAPHAFALAGDVVPATHGTDSVLGTGRIVVLHDPSEPEQWGGAWRVVSFANAPLEAEMGVDPFVADVAWSWLVDALVSRGARYSLASGTATKVLSTGYGELAGQEDSAQLELRASWSPLDSELGRHIEAWSDLVCMLAGLPQIPEGVALLQARRATRA